MPIDVVFHELAAREARDAEAWYAQRSADAAARFRQAVDAATERIAEKHHGLHALGNSRFWYVRLHRFPYRLIFVFKNETMARVLAVAHDRRRPGYWRRRN